MHIPVHSSIYKEQKFSSKKHDTKHHSEWKNIWSSISSPTYVQITQLACGMQEWVQNSSVLNNVLFLCFFHPYIRSFYGIKLFLLVLWQYTLYVAAWKQGCCLEPYSRSLDQAPNQSETEEMRRELPLQLVKNME